MVVITFPVLVLGAALWFAVAGHGNLITGAKKVGHSIKCTFVECVQQPTVSKDKPAEKK